MVLSKRKTSSPLARNSGTGLARKNDDGSTEIFSAGNTKNDDESCLKNMNLKQSNGYDNWEDDKELCKLLDKLEKEEAERKDDPELNVSWEYLMILYNWLNWLNIAKKKDRLMYEVWSDLECCFDCKHLNKKNIWCKLQDMPATINPVLTLRLGIVGMACMGMGKETWTQLNIEAIQ